MECARLRVRDTHRSFLSGHSRIETKAKLRNKEDAQYTDCFSLSSHILVSGQERMSFGDYDLHRATSDGQESEFPNPVRHFALKLFTPHLALSGPGFTRSSRDLVRQPLLLVRPRAERIVENRVFCNTQ